MRRTNRGGGRRKRAVVAAPRHAEKNRQLPRVDLNRLPLVVPEESGVGNSQASNGEIHQIRQALLRGGLLPRAGKVGDALGIGAEVHLEFIHVQVAQAKPPAQELPGAQARFHLAR